MVKLPIHFVAAEVSPLQLHSGKVKADSRRLLQFRGSTREVTFRGHRSLNRPLSLPAPLLRAGERVGEGRARGLRFMVPRHALIKESRLSLNVTSAAASRQVAAVFRRRSLRRSAETPLRAKERGALMVELVVAMAIIVIALFPLAFSFAQEAKFLRACYNRAVAMEIVDGEVEVLLAGEWRSFKEGAQDYAPRALAVTNLASGKFQLTRTGQRLRLEWLPAEKNQGAKVVREVTVK
jgi:hypothetical protein